MAVTFTPRRVEPLTDLAHDCLSDSHQLSAAEFVPVYFGMIIDSTGPTLDPTKLEAVRRMPRPQTVKDLRTFLGLTGYLWQFVPKYSLTAAALTNILRIKDFASNHGCKDLMAWEIEEDQALQSLR